MLIILSCFTSIATVAETYRTDLPNALDNSGWDLMLDKDDIQVFTKKWPGSDFVAIKGVQTIKSSLSNILGNFIDIESFPEWVKDAEKGYVIEPFDENKSRKIYLRMNLPWPLKDRDIVSGQSVNQNTMTKIVTIKEWYEGDTLPITEGVIRIPRLNTEFLLIPYDKNLTKLIWQGHNDPGGLIPSFLVNWLIENVFFTSMTAMKQRFEAPQHFKPVDWVLDFED